METSQALEPSSSDAPIDSVGHRPRGDKWEFDAEVTACFDDMLKRSIPQYEIMRKSVFEVGSRYVKHKTAVLDLGCSRGESLAPLIRKFGMQCRYIGIEVSKPMLAEAVRRYQGMIDTGIVCIRDTDLRHDFPQEDASLIMSVLTLQFIPINYRQEIIQKCYDALVPGGAMILVEKILGADAKVNTVLVEQYHQLKAENGYSKEDIDRKSLSLEGVLVPVTARWNEDLLREAGFRSIDCFWRYMNFAAWVAVKR